VTLSRATDCQCRAPGIAAGVTALCIFAFALRSNAAPVIEDDAASMSSLKTLSIEDLMNLEVTSVSKRGEPLSDAAAAVYVITREEILNSGARSLPDILR
jgi:outer membrane receptor for ferrienterochelin and colicin